MRSLVVMNRINVIMRPTTSGFNFSCLQAPQFDQTVIAGKEGNDKDWDRNRYRYRRYQAHFAYERYQTVCIRVFQDADGFCFIKIMGCQLSWESVCFASRRPQVRSLYAPLYADLTQPGECFPYKEEVGSSILSVGTGPLV